MDDVRFPQFLCIDENFKAKEFLAGKAGWMDRHTEAVYKRVSAGENDAGSYSFCNICLR